MTDITATTRINAASHVVFRRLSGEPGGVVLHLETAAYYRLNTLGVTIWEMLESNQTFASLLESVEDLLDDAPMGLEQDISDFLNDLAERDLVVLEIESA